jgi:filamentous hemagglutinin
MLRGRIAEVVHGRNLPFTFPVIDRFVDGIATSIKTIDLNASSYQAAKPLYNTLCGQINKVANFVGARRRNVVVQEHEINGRALDVLVPHSGNVAQKSAINQAIEYGARQGVTVNIIRHQ